MVATTEYLEGAYRHLPISNLDLTHLYVFLENSELKSKSIFLKKNIFEIIVLHNSLVKGFHFYFSQISTYVPFYSKH